MPLVPAICTQCGAQIEVDNTHEAGICKHCGTAFVTEKAISNYNIINNNNISANVVNIYGGNFADFVIRAGVLEKYIGSSTEVVIPSTVSIIGQGAFKDCFGLRKVTIPDSVTKIMWEAFYHCENLKEIIIPDSVTLICQSAFEWCEKLEKIIIPNSVTTIAGKAFSCCYNLSEIVLSNNISEISYGTFLGCRSLRKIVLPNGIVSIGNEAFAGCASLSEVIIPNSVKTIYNDAFNNCKNLKTIRIPDSVTAIEYPFGTAYGLNPGQYIENIEASEEWKKKHYTVAECLRDYKPKEETKKNDSGGCYIATCVYGSYDCPQVWTLRRFRDNTLDETWYGRVFIKCYYAISPTLVKWFGNQKWFRTFWKNRLDNMISKLNNKGVESTQYQDKY